MHIKINNKYHLTGDKRQFILHEKKGKGEELGYFTSLKGLVKSFILRGVRMNDNIRTLSQLGKDIDKRAEEIEEAFKEHIKYN